MATKFFSDVQQELQFYPDAPISETVTYNVAELRKFQDLYCAREGALRTWTCDDMSDDFIYRLAEDCATAKTELRKIFSRSKYWDKATQMVRLPITRPYKHDFDKIFRLVKAVFNCFSYYDDLPSADIYLLDDLASFFAYKAGDEPEWSINAVQKLLPRKWRKKKTSIFVAACELLGVTNSPKYRKLQEEISRQLNGEPEQYTLYVSLSPAMFLSSSNPRNKDDREEPMHSCHSWNGGCTWRQGCVGYARDKVTFVVFTFKKENDMYNRKQSRQLFHWHKGGLIQNRLYTTKTYESYGGVSNGNYPEYTEWRNAIQDLICECLQIKSEWVVSDYRNTNPKSKKYMRLNKQGVEGIPHEHYGGYIDWERYSNQSGVIRFSYLKCAKSELESFTIGEASLSIYSGDALNYWEDINTQPEHETDETG